MVLLVILRSLPTIPARDQRDQDQTSKLISITDIQINGANPLIINAEKSSSVYSFMKEIEVQFANEMDE